jgi:hypothetical protein
MWAAGFRDQRAAEVLDARQGKRPTGDPPRAQF